MPCKAKFSLVGVFIVLMALIVACGEEATPTVAPEAPPPPPPAAAPDPAAPTPVATARPTATPVATATPAPPPPAKVAPQGTLDVAIADLGPFATALFNQNFRYSVIEVRTTNELAFVLTPEGNVEPRLATGFDLKETPEGAIYTFKLQGGVPWHKNLGDWGEWNADDFIFSMRSASKEGSTQSSSGAIRRVFTCDECELTKIDDLTVQLKRPAPTITILWDITQYQGGSPGAHSKRHFTSRVGAGKEDQANLEAVGTGPWELVEQKTSQFRSFKAVQDHWRFSPDWEEMVWHDIVEDSTRVANFLAGILDTAAFSLEDIQTLKQENLPGVKFLSFAAGATQQLRIHGGQYYPDAPAHQPKADGSPAQRALGDGASYLDVCEKAAWVSCDRDTSSLEWDKARKVRQAMNLAIDREKLINNLAFGDGRPYFHPIFQGYDGRMKEFGLDKLVWDFDPQRARELLAEAGYPDGFDIDMFLVPRGPGAVEASQAVATMWQDVGINAIQEHTIGSAFRPKRVARTALGVSSYRNGPGNEPIRLYNLFYTSSSSFNQGFEHPEYEAMVKDTLETLDTDERFRKSAELGRWMFNNAMVISLYQEATNWPLGPEIDGWEMSASQLEFGNNWEKVPHRQ